MTKVLKLSSIIVAVIFTSILIFFSACEKEEEQNPPTQQIENTNSDNPNNKEPITNSEPTKWRCERGVLIIDMDMYETENKFYTTITNKEALDSLGYRIFFTNDCWSYYRMEENIMYMTDINGVDINNRAWEIMHLSDSIMKMNFYGVTTTDGSIIVTYEFHLR